MEPLDDDDDGSVEAERQTRLLLYEAARVGIARGLAVSLAG